MNYRMASTTGAFAQALLAALAIHSFGGAVATDGPLMGAARATRRSLRRLVVAWLALWAKPPARIGSNPIDGPEPGARWQSLVPHIQLPPCSSS